MGMTPEQIDAALFDSEQNDRMNEEAEKNRPIKEARKYRTGQGKYDGYRSSPVSVDNGIIDDDPLMAAYLWIKECLLVTNHEILEPGDLTLCPLSDDTYALYVSVFERTFVDQVAVLISRIGDAYKVSALASTELAYGLKNR